MLCRPKESSPPLIEKHTIGYIPPEDRHGKTRDLFTLWFGGNIAPLPIVTGALGVQIFHLNLLWGIAAIFSRPSGWRGADGVALGAGAADGDPADDPEPRAVWIFLVRCWWWRSPG